MSNNRKPLRSNVNKSVRDTVGSNDSTLDSEVGKFQTPQNREYVLNAPTLEDVTRRVVMGPPSEDRVPSDHRSYPTVTNGGDGVNRLDFEETEDVDDETSDYGNFPNVVDDLENAGIGSCLDNVNPKFVSGIYPLIQEMRVWDVAWAHQILQHRPGTDVNWNESRITSAFSTCLTIHPMAAQTQNLVGNRFLYDSDGNYEPRVWNMESVSQYRSKRTIDSTAKAWGYVFFGGYMPLQLIPRDDRSYHHQSMSVIEQQTENLVRRVNGVWLFRCRICTPYMGLFLQMVQSDLYKRIMNQKGCLPVVCFKNFVIQTNGFINGTCLSSADKMNKMQFRIIGYLSADKEFVPIEGELYGNAD